MVMRMGGGGGGKVAHILKSLEEGECSTCFSMAYTYNLKSEDFPDEI